MVDIRVVLPVLSAWRSPREQDRRAGTACASVLAPALPPVTGVCSHGSCAESGPSLRVRRTIAPAPSRASRPCVFAPGHTTYYCSWSPTRIHPPSAYQPRVLPAAPPKLRPDPSGCWWARPRWSNLSPSHAGSSARRPNAPASTPDIHTRPCLKYSLPSSAPARFLCLRTCRQGLSAVLPRWDPCLVSRCRSFLY